MSHYRLLLTFNKDNAENSKEARSYVQHTLEDDASFCGEGGMFHSSICDWFVIGGRWSGELSENTWAKKVMKEIQKLLTDNKIGVRGTWYGDKKIQAKQAKLEKKIEKLYQESIPAKYKSKGLIYNRDGYTDYEDDAMIVTKELYNHFLKEYTGQSKCDQDEYGGCQFLDLDFEEVNEEFIGKKYLVVVDYHS